MNVDTARDPSPDHGPSTPPETDDAGRADAAPEVADRPLFLHPQWMVGVVLIFAVAAIVAGINNPVWWLIGSPCILVLVVYAWVRLKN